MLREMRDLLSYHKRWSKRLAEHDVKNVFGKAMRDLGRLGFDQLEGKRVLDLGCGQRFAFALQCASQGAKVTALDIAYVKPGPMLVALERTVKRDGLQRAAKTAARRILFDKSYYRTLEAASGKPLHAYHSKIEFVLADPEGISYPLPSNTYDLIASNVVVEHVRDVPRFAAEIKRLLKLDGYFYAIIHNFYSLSGGHNVEWAFPDERPSSRVPPWDHLRRNLYPARIYLNRLRPEEYREAFAEHLQIVLFEARDVNYDPGTLEGQRFLTETLAAELAAYPKELLLTRAWCLICMNG